MNTILTVIYQFTQREYFIFLIVFTLIPVSIFLVSKLFSTPFSKRDFFVSLFNYFFPLFFILLLVVFEFRFKTGVNISNTFLVQLGFFLLFLINTFQFVTNITKFKLILFGLFTLLPLTPIIYLRNFNLFSLIAFALSLLITTTFIAIFSKRDEYED